MKNSSSIGLQRLKFAIPFLALTLAACQPATPTTDPNALMTAAFATVNSSYTQTALVIPTSTVAPAKTVRPFQPLLPTAFVPTVILPVTIQVPLVFCRFGPDQVYVSPYGIRLGKVREAIGRDTSGTWLLVRETGGTKPCWIISTSVTIQGDAASLPIAPVELSFNTKYQPPTNINVSRNNDQITISWGEVALETRDIYPDSHYLLDVWLCKDGTLSESLVGTNDNQVILTDSLGCSPASHGQIYTASKAGYSLPVQIPWQ